MKFNEFKYERPDVKAFKTIAEECIKNIGDKDLKTNVKAVEDYLALNDDFDSMAQLVGIRYSVNTKDEFYENEEKWFNNVTPELQAYDAKFKEALLASTNRLALEEKFGKLMFDQAELAKKTFKPEIIPLLQKENNLSTEHSKLMAGAEIDFEGEIRNLSQMTPFLTNKDRDMRHRAQLAVSDFLETNETQIDRIYDDMVKVRHEIAKELGYENFVQLGYDRLGRLDYNALDVKGYRDQILKEVVPYVAELTKRKGARIGIEDMKSWDLGLGFKTGNPKPQGDRAWCVEKATIMYDQMSPETSEFFHFMKDRELLELDAKPGKSGGGYCTFIPKYNSPYIFANLNGTAGDVDVLTHEAGHAFQVYSSRDNIAPYRWPTYEAAEIHSMSMEFLAWPWIHYFFEGDTDKYKFSHLAGAVTFLPYGALVDHYQHEVYENPEMTPDQRKATWRKLEKEYLPYKDYDDDAFMEKGTYWYRQGHIFGSPFYYIDYTLAQVCAFQYFKRSRENHEDAFKNYLALCKLGGSKTFVNLVKSAGLNNPFVDGTIKDVMIPIKAYLDSVDDSKL